MPSDARRRWVRARWLVAVVAAVLAGGVVLGLALRRSADGVVEFPPPLRDSVMTSGVAFGDFAGAESCGECHETQYQTWRGSTHGRAGGPPSPETVIAPFEGTPIRFRDAVVIPSRNARGEYLFTVRQERRNPVVFRVDGVIGRGHMVGGGTQGFVSAFPDGTLRFLPFDFARAQGVWFCNTNTRLDGGWVPITPRLSLVDCGDWPPVRVLGSEPRYANCQECHGSQIRLRYDPGAKQFATTFKSLRVNCESCHGPGRVHIDLARAGRLGDEAAIGMRALGNLDKDESLEVCFQCHALKDVLAPGYLPGERLSAFYSLKLPLVAEQPLFPDGRVRTFAYQENHLYSDCYLNGSMTCVDCHDPHSQGYRDIYGRPLQSRFSDDQCLDCHASKARDIGAHTHHAAASAGSRCVACHMPYLQHPEVGDRIDFARSDHTIAIPRPAFDARLGIESACAKCHGDLGVATLQRHTDEWYGELKPHKAIVAGIVAADTGLPSGTTADMVLHPDATHPMAQVAALNQLVNAELRPDMPALARRTVEALERLAGNPDVDVQAVALAALHLARGADPAVRRFLAQRLRGLGEWDGAVRRRWAVVLGFLGDRYRSRGDIPAGIVTYRKGLEVLPRHPGLLLNLAAAYGVVQDYPNAIEYYNRALEVHPDRALVLVNMGVVLDRMGRPEDAVAAYREAVEYNPREALAHLNLGNYHLRREAYAEAIREYRLAVASDPGLARAHYYLARSYIATNRLDSALAAARTAVEFEPDNDGAQQMVRDLERALAR